VSAAIERQFDKVIAQPCKSGNALQVKSKIPQNALFREARYLFKNGSGLITQLKTMRAAESNRSRLRVRFKQDEDKLVGVVAILDPEIAARRGGANPVSNLLTAFASSERYFSIVACFKRCKHGVVLPLNLLRLLIELLKRFLRC
jgi:hypothetical protein